MVIFWLTYRPEQTTNYVIVQTPDPFPQSLISQTDWNIQNFSTKNTQTFSTPQVFQSFSHKCKCLFLQSRSKEFIRPLCESVVNLLQRDLQNIKRHHVTEIQNEVWLLFCQKKPLEATKARSGIRKRLQIIGVIIPPVIDHLSWYGGVCSRPCFSVQQQEEFEYWGSYKAGASNYQAEQNPTYQTNSLKK